MATELQGVAELTAQLAALGDRKAWVSTLKASVAAPMRLVAKKAKANLLKVSPGERELHRTWRGRLVSRGFAARSVRVVTSMNRKKTTAYAKLGVRREAFYAIQFFELGTAHIAKREWLRPAFESSRSQALQKIGATMKARIERIARKRAAAGKK